MGPVEYAVFGFPGNKFKGEIIPALADLVESGTIRILDLLFILKDADGNIEGFEIQDLPEEVAGLGALTTDTASLLNDEDIELAAAELPPNSSAALLVIENVWADRLVHAIRNADGEMFAHERIPAAVVEAAMADLANEA
jgi:hypothetical protein